MKLKQINLIPKELLKKPLLKQLSALYAKNAGLRKSINILSLIILASLIQMAFLGIFSVTFNLSKREQQQTKARLNQMQAKYVNLEKLKLDLTKEDIREKERLDLLLSTFSKGKLYSQLLLNVAGLIPPKDLWITRFVLSDSQIQITGATLDNELIPQFMAKLEESKMFKDSRFNSSERQTVESQSLYNFQIITEPVWESIRGNK